MRKLIELLKRLRKDDVLHFTVSLIVAWAVATAAGWLMPEGVRDGIAAAAFGFVFSFGLGLYKEVVLDGQASLYDLIADVLGASVGVIMYCL